MSCWQMLEHLWERHLSAHKDTIDRIFSLVSRTSMDGTNKLCEIDINFRINYIGRRLYIILRHSSAKSRSDIKFRILLSRWPLHPLVRRPLHPSPTFLPKEPRHTPSMSAHLCIILRDTSMLLCKEPKRHQLPEYLLHRLYSPTSPTFIRKEPRHIILRYSSPQTAKATSSIASYVDFTQCLQRCGIRTRIDGYAQ